MAVIETRIGIRLESLGVPIRDAIVLAASLRAHGVQFDAVGELAPDQLSQTGRRHLRHLLSSHSLKLAAIGFPTRRGFDSLERLEARIAGTCRALSYAREMGALCVVNHIGKIPTLDRGDVRHAHFFEALERVGHEAERVGCRFAIETAQDSIPDLVALLDLLKLHGLAVNFDPANLVARGHDVYEPLAGLGERVVGVHVKDVVRSGTIAGAEEVPLGQGILDWEVLLGGLEQIAYPGFFTLEREAPVHSIKDIADGVAFLHKTGADR